MMPLLQVCSGSTSGTEYLLQWEFIKAVTCTYADAAGLLATGLLVYGAVAGSIYIRTGSVIIPFGLLLLTGGATMSAVAGPGVAIATIVVLLVGGGVVAYLYHQYSR